MELSVSIVVYDLDKVILAKCLMSLKKELEEAHASGIISKYNLTIVDNAQNLDGLLELEKQVDIKWEYIKAGKNLGFGKAHNVAIRNSRSDIHLVLNPDVIFEPEAISHLASSFCRDRATILAGPFGKKLSGENARLCKRYPSITALALRALHIRPVGDFVGRILSNYEYHDRDFVDRETEVLMLSGCCMIGRTRDLQIIGGFDESFFLYFEDFDLSLRCSELGKVIYHPRAVIYHLGGDAAKKGFRHVMFFCNSAVRFFRKHGWKIV